MAFSSINLEIQVIGLNGLQIVTDDVNMWLGAYELKVGAGYISVINNDSQATSIDALSYNWIAGYPKVQNGVLVSKVNIHIHSQFFFDSNNPTGIAVRFKFTRPLHGSYCTLSRNSGADTLLKFDPDISNEKTCQSSGFRFTGNGGLTSIDSDYVCVAYNVINSDNGNYVLKMYVTKNNTRITYHDISGNSFPLMFSPYSTYTVDNGNYTYTPEKYDTYNNGSNIVFTPKSGSQMPMLYPSDRHFWIDQTRTYISYKNSITNKVFTTPVNPFYLGGTSGNITITYGGAPLIYDIDDFDSCDLYVAYIEKPKYEVTISKSCPGGSEFGEISVLDSDGKQLSSFNRYTNSGTAFCYNDETSQIVASVTSQAYKFVHWKKDGNVCTTEMAIDVTESCTLEAVYAKTEEYSVTTFVDDNSGKYNAENGAYIDGCRITVTPSANATGGKYYENTSITITCTGSVGYNYSRMLIVKVAADGSETGYTFTPTPSDNGATATISLQANTRIYAQYSAKTYSNVSVVVDEESQPFCTARGINKNGTGTFNYNDILVCTVSNLKRVFDGWYINGVKQSSSEQWEHTVKGDVTVVAKVSATATKYRVSIRKTAGASSCQVVCKNKHTDDYTAPTLASDYTVNTYYQTHEYEVESGTIVELECTATGGYNFVGWNVGTSSHTTPKVSFEVTDNITAEVSCSSKNVFYIHPKVHTYNDSDTSKYNEDSPAWQDGCGITVVSTPDQNGGFYEGSNVIVDIKGSTGFSYYSSSCWKVVNGEETTIHGWNTDNLPDGGDGRRITITNISANINLYAKFTRKTFYNVYVRPDDSAKDFCSASGKNKATGSTSYKYKDTLVCTATNLRRDFEGWYINGVKKSGANPWECEVLGDMTVLAKVSAQKKYYTVTVNKTPNASASSVVISNSHYGSYTTPVLASSYTMGAAVSSYAYRVEAGTTVQLKCNPYSAYIFSQWILGGSGVGTYSTYTITNISQNYNITAACQQKPAYDLDIRCAAIDSPLDADGWPSVQNAASDAGCKLTIDTTKTTLINGKIIAGQTVYQESEAAPGWEVTTIEVYRKSDRENLHYHSSSAGNTAKIENCFWPYKEEDADDVIDIAYFKRSILDIRAEIDNPSRNFGSVSVVNDSDGGEEIAYQDTARFVATPNAGYTFWGWYNGSDEVSKNATYTTQVTSDLTLVAKFGVTLVVEVDGSSNANGDVTLVDQGPSGSGMQLMGAGTKRATVPAGNFVKMQATVSEGSYFVGWFRDNEKLNLSATDTVQVLDNVTLSARFMSDADSYFIVFANINNVTSQRDSSLGDVNVTLVEGDSQYFKKLTETEFITAIGASSLPEFFNGTLTYYKVFGVSKVSISAMIKEAAFIKWAAKPLIKDGANYSEGTEELKLVPSATSETMQLSVAQSVMVSAYWGVQRKWHFKIGRAVINSADEGSVQVIQVVCPTLSNCSRYTETINGIIVSYSANGTTISKDDSFDSLNINPESGEIEFDAMQGSVITYSCSIKNGYKIRGWYESNNPVNLNNTVSTESMIKFALDNDHTRYAVFEQSKSSLFAWDKGSSNKVMTWRSGRVVFPQPFNPTAARIYADKYNYQQVAEGDPESGSLELQIDTFSSPDTSAKSEDTTSYTVDSQDSFRLIQQRPEKYLEFEVRADNAVNDVAISSSMGGLMV